MKEIEEASKKFRRKFEIEFIPEISERDKTGVAFEAGANFILEKWKEAERWRDVNEELPEITQNATSSRLIDHKSDLVLVKTEYGGYDVAFYSPYFGDFIAGKASISGVTHWKPIKE